MVVGRSVGRPVGMDKLEIKPTQPKLELGLGLSLAIFFKYKYKYKYR